MFSDYGLFRAMLKLLPLSMAFKAMPLGRLERLLSKKEKDPLPLRRLFSVDPTYGLCPYAPTGSRLTVREDTLPGSD